MSRYHIGSTLIGCRDHRIRGTRNISPSPARSGVQNLEQTNEARFRVFAKFILHNGPSGGLTGRSITKGLDLLFMKQRRLKGNLLFYASQAGIIRNNLKLNIYTTRRGKKLVPITIQLAPWLKLFSATVDPLILPIMFFTTHHHHQSAAQKFCFLPDRNSITTISPSSS